MREALNLILKILVLFVISKSSNLAPCNSEFRELNALE